MPQHSKSKSKSVSKSTTIRISISRQSEGKRTADAKMVRRRHKIAFSHSFPMSGPVAQRLEQGTHNPLVVGSSPTGPTNYTIGREHMMKKTKQPFPVQAARFSFWAPFIAFFLNAVTSATPDNTASSKIIIGGLCSFIILAGFALATFALISIRKHGKKGILGYSLAGFILNGIVVISTIIVSLSMRERVRSTELKQEFAQEAVRVFQNGQFIFNEQISYSFEIPPNFEHNPEALKNPIFKYGYIRKDSDGNGIAITIQHLNGLIPNEPLDGKYIAAMKQQLPLGSQVELLRAPWEEYTVDGFLQRIPMQFGYVTACAYQVPLARGAIQVNVAGPSQNEKEIQEIAKLVLTSVQGKSNWK